MKDITQNVKPDQFPHTIVVTESGDCKCGKTHQKGDAVWGGKERPKDVPGENPVSVIKDLHSLNVKVVTDT